MPHLPMHPGCSQCDLGCNSRSKGLATRAYSGNTGSDTALLILGKAPTYEEDKQGSVFVGEAGIYCEKVYVKGHKLSLHADVFMQNIVRCRLPHPEMAVPTAAVTACRPYLEYDLEQLSGTYKEVVLLCVGPDAVKAICGEKVNFNTFEQGQQVTLGGRTYHCFATYNPAILGQRKDPAKINAITEHLQLLVDYLTHKEFRYQINNFEYLRGEPLPEVIDDGILSLDTETYGAIAGYPTQRFFHPAKCMFYDSVQRGDLVQVGSLACRTNGRLWACSYDLRNSKEYALWQEVSDRLRTGSSFGALSGTTTTSTTCTSNSTPFTLVGQNFAFDILMLRCWCSKWRETLTPYSIAVEDLMVWNFLENDQRPERSLKPLSKLLGVTTYAEELSLKKGDRYDSSADPRIHVYAAKDALATLVCREVLRGRICNRFGAGSPKVSDYSKRWFSDLIWLCTELGESGIKYARAKLEANRAHADRRCGQLVDLLGGKYDLILRGKGSKSSKSEFITRCFQELDIPVAPGRTKLKKDVKADLENLNLILDNGDPRSPLYRVASLWSRYTEKAKLVSSYYTPMLGLKEKSAAKKATKPTKKNPNGKPARPAVMDLRSALCDDMAYPTWYPVPSYHSLGAKKDQQQQGGTKQARIVAQNHGAQTEPPVVSETIVSRYGTEGIVVYRDGSQIELRVGGGLSKDPGMLEVYRQGRNFHAESATRLFGFPVNKKTHPMHYHGGKTANFLRLFRGEWKKLQQTTLKDCKVYVPDDQCISFLAADKSIFPRFYAWQGELIDRAIKYGFLETPLVGISRAFMGGRGVIEATYIPDICNVLVQAVAAMLIQSAQVSLQKAIGTRRVHLVKNVYDAGYYDMHAEEYPWWLQMSEALYDNPPYLHDLKASGHWDDMPLASETKIVYNGPGI